MILIFRRRNFGRLNRRPASVSISCHGSYEAEFQVCSQMQSTSESGVIGGNAKI